MRLGLGTVRLGQRDYGLAGEAVATDDAAVERMLALACSRGVELFDTAPAYGEAEAILGRLLPSDRRLRIVTKTRVFRREIGPRDRTRVIDDFRRSQDRLRRDRLEGLLVHDADDLLRPRGEHIFEALTTLRDGGSVARLGVSVYDGEQLDALVRRFPIDLVQVPVNLLDQRLAGRLQSMMARGIEVHARSVFLQGLLLTDPDRTPERFRPIREHLSRCERMTRGLGLTRIQAALAFVAGLDGLGAVICGADSPAQLAEICEAMEADAPATGVDWSAYRLDDPRFVDPRRWQESPA